MANKTLQLLRNTTLHSSHTDALNALKAKLATAADGEPILARYYTGTQGESNYEEHTLLGIAGKTKGKYEIFDNAGSQSGAVKSVEYDRANKKITYTKFDGTTDVVTTDELLTDMELNVSEIGAGGKVITAVSETKGKVGATATDFTDVVLGGYAKTAHTGAIAATDTLEEALSKLENKAASITVASADKTVKVTNSGTGTDLAVNIDNTTLVKDDSTGVISSNLTILKETTGLETNVKEQYKLVYGNSTTAIGQTIKIYKDSSLLSVALLHADTTSNPQVLPTYDKQTDTWTDIASPTQANQALCFAYENVDGVVVVAAVPVGSFINEQEFAKGVAWNSTSGKVEGVVDDASENFLTVGANGFKVSGVQDAIDAAETAAKSYTNTKIEALDVTTDSAVAGQYVAAIEETNGVVAVKTRANVSAAVLNNYAKGSAATAVAATDTVNEAISKLENQVDAAKAAATTKVAKDAAATHLTLSETTGADNSKTYTIGENDIASASSLTNEIAARKAVDGQNGDTYTRNTNANYINNATSLNDADVKLDTALKTADDAMLTGVAAGNGISVSTKESKSQTISVKLDSTSNEMLTVGAGGLKLSSTWDCGEY